jgi:hypothetical protein
MLVKSTVAASVEPETKNNTGTGEREQMLEERRRSHGYGSIVSIQTYIFPIPHRAAGTLMFGHILSQAISGFVVNRKMTYA